MKLSATWLALATFAALGLGSAAFAFDAQGHRGARGLAPENSLPAFAAALSLGVNTLEFDTQITRDGQIVVTHDPLLNPRFTRDEGGKYLTSDQISVLGLSLAELKRYDIGRLDGSTQYGRQFSTQKPFDGTRIPTLGEVFALVRKSGNGEVRFNIETKIDPEKPNLTPGPDAYAAKLVDALRAEGMLDRSAIQSFDWRTLQVVQKIAPSVPTVYLSAELPNFDTIRRTLPGAGPWTAGFDVKAEGGSLPRTVKAAGGAIWSPNFRNLTADTLAEARKLGLKTVVWTVNEEPDMTRLIDMGVDGIISDYPDRLRRVMATKGMALPRATPVEP